MDRARAILLVGASAEDEALTRLAFQRVGIANRLELAPDGEAALQRLHDSDRPLPVLVLLDLRLRGIDGFEVLRRLRADARTRLLPVVVLTRTQAERDEIDSLHVGANSHVRVPVEPEPFVAAMQQLGMYWLALNVSPRGEPR